MLIEAYRLSFAANLLFSEENIHPRRVELDPTVANGCKDASPVWICSRPRRLHQQRMRNCPRNAIGLFPAARLLHEQTHNMPYAFAIGHDLRRQRTADLGQRICKPCASRSGL